MITEKITSCEKNHVEAVRTILPKILSALKNVFTTTQENKKLIKIRQILDKQKRPKNPFKRRYSYAKNLSIFHLWTK